MAKRRHSKAKPHDNGSEVLVEQMTAPVVEKERSEVAEGVYRRVGKEVLSGDLDPVCWAKALTESGSGHDEALALYARIRTGDLTKQVGPQVKKSLKLECRMAEAYRETDEAPPLGPIDFQSRGGMGRAMDAIFWHCVAVIAALGCLMAAQIIWPDLRSHLIVNRVVMIVVAFQLFPIIAWVSAGRNGFYSVLNYSEAAHMSACVAIVASVAFGGYLLVGKQSASVEFSPEKSSGSLLVVMPEDQLVRPVVYAEGIPTKRLEVVSAEEEGR
jgi:hypothetical protein